MFPRGIDFRNLKRINHKLEMSGLTYLFVKASSIELTFL
jgi:hypothetical protein